MTKKIPQELQRKIIQKLANNEPTRAISEELNVPRSTLHEFKPQAETLKKEIAEDFHKDTAERILTLSKKMLSIVESGAEVLTRDVIAQQSGAAIATTMGILVDKMQLLTGGATENVQISAGPKSEDFLSKLREKSRRNVSAKIVEAETITRNQEVSTTGKALENEGDVNKSN